MAVENIFQLSGVGGKANSVEGPPIAASTTLAPTHMMHRITGATAITTISLPHASFNGILILIPAAANVLGTAGNIATTTTLATSVPAVLIYSTSAGKWYVK